MRGLRLEPPPPAALAAIRSGALLEIGAMARELGAVPPVRLRPGVRHDQCRCPIAVTLQWALREHGYERVRVTVGYHAVTVDADRVLGLAFFEMRAPLRRLAQLVDLGLVPDLVVPERRVPEAVAA